jgi:hypothetical protein
MKKHGIVIKMHNNVGVIFLNPINMKNSLLTGLVLRYTEVTCSLVIPWLCYIYAHQCHVQMLSIYTLAFSPSFLLLYSLKTRSKTPNFSYCKTNNDFGKPTSIQNRQKDAESRKKIVRSR